MAKDYHGQEITPALYIGFEDHDLYRVFESKGILMIEDSATGLVHTLNSFSPPLSSFSTLFVRTNPNKEIEFANKRIEWIRKNFSETIQNPTNPQSSQTS